MLLMGLILPQKARQEAVKMQQEMEGIISLK
jgi:hypothetical protein